jgi:hypothetical protein
MKRGNAMKLPIAFFTLVLSFSSVSHAGNSEDFDVFIKVFSKDKIFASKRTIYPVVYEEQDDGSPSPSPSSSPYHAKINQDEFEKHYMMADYIHKNGLAIYKIIDLPSCKCKEVAVVKGDTDWSLGYVFEQKNGLWYLKEFHQ